MRIHLIPGVNITDYDRSIGAWRPYIEAMGHTVINHPRFIPIGLAWAMNPGFIHSILRTVCADDILIGHSNGCAVAHGVSQRVRCKGLIFLNAALDRDIRPGYVDFIHNWYCPGDDALKWADAIPNHIWGKAGRKGITTPDPRIKNLSMKEYDPAVRGHSDIFDGKHAHFWAPRVIQMATQ